MKTDTEVIRALRAVLAEARKVIDRDRTGLAAGLAQVKRIAAAYQWIKAGEWGSYSWEERTEKTLRSEIAGCLDQIDVAAGRALKDSGKLATRAVLAIDAALASTPAGQPDDEVKRLREENARFKEQRRSVESGLAMLEMGVCARTLAGDQKDWRTTRRALTICVERLQEVRALLVKDTEDSADED